MSEDLIILIDKYLKGEATEAELALVDTWYLSFEKEEGFTDRLSPEEIESATEQSFASLSRQLKLD